MAQNPKVSYAALTIESVPETTPPDLHPWVRYAALTVSGASTVITLTWADPADADLDHINIYRSALDSPIDLTTVYDTVAAGVQTFEDYWPADTTGLIQYAIRAVDSASNEEANIHEVVKGTLSFGAQALPPNTPYDGSATASGSGTAIVRCWYTKEAELAVATAVRVYWNDGTGGAINYGAYQSVALVGTFEEEAIVSVTGLTGGLTYQFAARAYTTGAVPSENLTGMSCVIDTTAPGALTLSGEVI